MAEEEFEMLFWQGYPPGQGRYPGFNPRTEKAKGMIIERDVAVAMRDGAKIYIDIFRPENEGKYPVLVCWGPYGKHGRFPLYSPSADVRHDLSEYTAFESADPVYWCAKGYIIINPDPRDAWNSEGDLTFMSSQEAEDCYDLIEWAGTQNWSNEKVGMYGVSYLAWTQWKVAALNPPHLAAINPWEGVSDFYREFCFHGGIPETARIYLLGSGGTLLHPFQGFIISAFKPHVNTCQPGFPEAFHAFSTLLRNELRRSVDGDPLKTWELLHSEKAYSGEILGGHSNGIPGREKDGPDRASIDITGILNVLTNFSHRPDPVSRAFFVDHAEDALVMRASYGSLYEKAFRFTGGTIYGTLITHHSILLPYKTSGPFVPAFSFRPGLSFDHPPPCPQKHLSSFSPPSTPLCSDFIVL